MREENKYSATVGWVGVQREIFATPKVKTFFFILIEYFVLDGNEFSLFGTIFNAYIHSNHSTYLHDIWRHMKRNCVSECITASKNTTMTQQVYDGFNAKQIKINKWIGTIQCELAIT